MCVPPRGCLHRLGYDRVCRAASHCCHFRNRRELHNRCSSIQMCQRSLLRPHGAEVIRNATVAHGGQLCPLMAVKMSRGHRFRHISDLVQSTRGQFGIWVKLFSNKGTRRRLLIGCGTQWRQSNTALLMRLMMLC